MYECPICRNKTCENEPKDGIAQHKELRNINAIKGECRICGEFLFYFDLLFHQPIDQETRNLISSINRFISEQKKIGIRENILLFTNLDEIKKSCTIPESPNDKMRHFMYILSKKQKKISQYIDYNPEYDYSLWFADNCDESIIYLMNLIDNGYIETPSDDPITNRETESPIFTERKIRFTLSGWDYVDKLFHEGYLSNQAFIAMHFDSKANELLEYGFYPALKHCGYLPYSSLLDKHNESINDKIIANIRKSSLVIADVTGSSENVYYEAGFAKGLGIPVIFTCQKDHFDEDSKFDTGHIKHIKWKDTKDLNEKLIDTIEATGLIKK